MAPDVKQYKDKLQAARNTKEQLRQ
jgi:hypothetical protein